MKSFWHIVTSEKPFSYTYNIQISRVLCRNTIRETWIKLHTYLNFREAVKIILLLRTCSSSNYTNKIWIKNEFNEQKKSHELSANKQFWWVQKYHRFATSYSFRSKRFSVDFIICGVEFPLWWKSNMPNMEDGLYALKCAYQCQKNENFDHFFAFRNQRRTKPNEWVRLCGKI